MIELCSALLSWLPFPLNLVCAGAIALFFLFTLLHVGAFILDFIPFL